MSITTFFVNNELLEIASKSKHSDDRQLDRLIELTVFPKYTEVFREEMIEKLDQLAILYNYDPNKDFDLSSEFRLLENTNPFVTSKKIWWGNETTGMHIYINLTKQYASVQEIEKAFERGLEDNLFQRIHLIDQGKDIFDIVFKSDEFSITIGGHLKFSINGRIPTQSSEFESISQALEIISNYLSDNSTIPRNSILPQLTTLLKYGIEEINIQVFEEKIFSLFNTSTKVGVMLGGLELAINGVFPKITENQVVDFIDYLKGSQDININKLFDSIGYVQGDLTLTNSEGINLFTFNLKNNEKDIADDLTIIENGINSNLWGESVPLDLFSFVFNGTEDLDTVVFSTTRSSLIKSGDFYKVGENVLTGIERIKFSDGYVALDLSGKAGQAAKILGAALGKEAVESDVYMGIALHYLDNGMSYDALMSAALNLVLGDQAKVHSNVVKLLFKNILDIDATNEMVKPFVSLLDNGMNMGILGTLAAETPQNAINIDLVDMSESGVDYLPFV